MQLLTTKHSCFGPDIVAYEHFLKRMHAPVEDRTIMTKTHSHSIPEADGNPTAALDLIKAYPLTLRRMIHSVWNLLLINLLILGIVLYKLVFAKAMPENLPMAHVLLHGLILYFIIFPCMQALFHLLKLREYRTQLDLCKILMAGIISEPDYALYIRQPLRNIRILSLAYAMSVLLHLAMAFACYYLKYYVL